MDGGRCWPASASGVIAAGNRLDEIRQYVKALKLPIAIASNLVVRCGYDVFRMAGSDAYHWRNTRTDVASSERFETDDDAWMAMMEDMRQAVFRHGITKAAWQAASIAECVKLVADAFDLPQAEWRDLLPAAADIPDVSSTPAMGG